jgi:hypothetical protein
LDFGSCFAFIVHRSSLGQARIAEEKAARAAQKKLKRAAHEEKALLRAERRAAEEELNELISAGTGDLMSML